MKTEIFEKNWFWVGLVAVLLLMMQLAHLSPIPQINHAIYDTSLNLIHKSPGSADKIVIVSLHKAELLTDGAQLDTKEALIKLLASLRKARTKSIGVLIPLADEQHRPGLSHLDTISEYVKEAKLSKATRRRLNKLLVTARNDIDTDSQLTQQISRSRNVFFPFHVSEVFESAPGFIHYYLLNTPENNVDYSNPASFLMLPKNEQTVIYDNAWPIESFATAARGLGYLSQLIDMDGRVRSVQLAQPYKDDWIASLPLVLAANSLNTRVKDIDFKPGAYISIDNRTIPIDSANRMYPSFYSALNEAQPVFPHYSYTQVMSGEIPARDLRNKIILVDAPDFHRVDNIITPIGEVSGVAELTAHAVTSILNQDVYKRPATFLWLEFGLFILVGLYLILLLPRFRLTTGSLISLFILFVLLAIEEYLLLSKQAWLHAGASIIFLVIGYVVVAAQRLFNAQHAIHAEDVHYTNRQLGLMLQEQGKLELAFERLQKLIPTTENLDLIYNLALDFERKRKFNNAASAYRYILQHQGHFRDVKERADRAEHMQHSVTMGTGQFSAIGSLLVEGNEKPMLGRYVIEKELGRGAMGAVYLGRDPKIDRVVAVKTLALAQEFESDEIEEVESRFFHEASAAGRLNHPNIVTIYDAAEDHDLAYIAMEYIEGKPLSDFVRKSALLPVPTVLNIIAKTADALEYAGKQGIVHRDIKPANIMYNEVGNITKITDFGIARIASTGRTKTGMILGTPSYMSPEQMNGEHVDSRSDIFSLGVTMFVLLTGQKPFSGDSLASISYKIVNEKHPDVTSIRKDLPDAVKTIIDKALQKKPDKRYQSGSIMRRAILRCLKAMETQK